MKSSKGLVTGKLIEYMHKSKINEDNFIKGHSFISGVAEDTSRSAFRVGYSVGMRDGIKMQQIRIQSSLGLIVKK